MLVFAVGAAGKDGYSGFGSDDGFGVVGGHGAGQGGTAHNTVYPGPSPGTAQGGGGGGHGVAGADFAGVFLVVVNAVRR